MGAYLFAPLDDDEGLLAEHWNGRHWKATKLSRGGFASLEAVSCPSPGSCIAVGASFMTQGIPGFPVAERWNGRRWAKMPSVTIRRSGGQLEGVSCITARDCVAAGFDAIGLRENQPQPKGFKLLVQRLYGNRWRLQRIRQATGPKNVTTPQLGFAPTFSAVSCWQRTRCLAVGASLLQRRTGIPDLRDTVPLAEISSR